MSLKIEGLTQSGWVTIVSDVELSKGVTKEEAVENTLENLGSVDRLWMGNVSFYPKSFLAIRIT